MTRAISEAATGSFLGMRRFRAQGLVRVIRGGNVSQLPRSSYERSGLRPRTRSIFLSVLLSGLCIHMESWH